MSLSFQAGLAGECYALSTGALSLVLTSLYYCFCNLELFQDFWLCALSMSSPPSHVEPFYGTICLYNRERREKLSEDFYFRHAPTEKKDVSYKINITFSPSNFNGCPLLRHMLWLKTFLLPLSSFLLKISFEPRGIFYLDAPSSSVCLLIQLEKHATEEGGVTPSVYSRKEPVCPRLYVTFLLFIHCFQLVIMIWNLFCRNWSCLSMEDHMKS